MCSKDLKYFASTKRKNDNEIISLEEVLNQVKNELNLNTEELAFAAISLAVGSSPLLTNENESWIRQSGFKGNRNESKVKRSKRDFSKIDNHMECFRVDIGRRDRVKPANIVGAIANESGLRGNKIGRIQIFDSYTLVDLPKGMPASIFNNLKTVRVMNKELNIKYYS